MNNKTVLITGCSTGFGKFTARLFQSKGWNVIATMRSPEKETELDKLANVLVTRLDVTDPQSITDAINAGMKQFGTIDALVNNAGISGMGVFEQWDVQEINAIFNTNVYGPMRVAQQVLPIMRKQKTGVIINISSLAGILGSPYSSIYSAAKFAIEGLTEALALEYAPFNIKTKVIAPGAYETNLFTTIPHRILANGDQQIRDYSDKMRQKMNATMEQMRQQGTRESDPHEVADKIYQCVTEDTPVHNVSGSDAEAILQMKKSMPEDQLMKAVSDMFVPEVHTA
ncbi:SDR family oxidoreductase [Vibrio ezurae]|uniref:Putative oxidoreductase n=1 Tax=Vibrio ezurae NBRC 102218 TaxID=1219080 RepID=U3B1X7_9VIBR|nr:SDR family oxidoreductase [Vibrio ezurae]GAD79975.1 putative oxidoreductase [Vibrio ezurae NBRC 102218]